MAKVGCNSQSAALLCQIPRKSHCGKFTGSIDAKVDAVWTFPRLIGTALTPQGCPGTVGTQTVGSTMVGDCAAHAVLGGEVAGLVNPDSSGSVSVRSILVVAIGRDV